ncbi:MAG: hypothetical protein J0I41_04510 [Filimonas sp.]|nr:hypothetical protein [Filimonas sp.]
MKKIISLVFVVLTLNYCLAQETRQRDATQEASTDTTLRMSIPEARNYLSLKNGSNYNDETLDNKFIWNEKKNKVTFTGWALNSNFILPGVRFNFLKDPKNSKGSVEYFNSAGAGISFTYGNICIKDKNGNKITSTTDRDDLDISMSNLFGISIGVLFSQSNTDSSKRTIFAPMVGFQILDFHIGVGKELGTTNDYKQVFMTITYAVPLQKLTNVGSFLLTRLQLPRTKSTSNTSVKKSYLF